MTVDFVFPDNPDLVLLAGDWHGNAYRAVEAIRFAGNNDVKTVVHLGDFGFWTPGDHSQRYLDAVEQECFDWGITLLWVDGNHECHPALNDLPINEFGVRPISEHVAHLPRGFRWTWHGKRWMALGGAHSVDTYMRKEGVSVWDEEHLSDDDVLHAIEGGEVDVMVCHDCPDKVHIPDLPSNMFPVYEIYRADQHRHKLGGVVDAVRPKALYHGHYHTRYTSFRDLPNGGRTHVMGLADDGASLTDNVAILDLNA